MCLCTETGCYGCSTPKCKYSWQAILETIKYSYKLISSLDITDIISAAFVHAIFIYIRFYSSTYFAVFLQLKLISTIDCIWVFT